MLSNADDQGVGRPKPAVASAICDIGVTSNDESLSPVVVGERLSGRVTCGNSASQSVGLTGFEPATPCSNARRATGMPQIAHICPDLHERQGARRGPLSGYASF